MNIYAKILGVSGLPVYGYVVAKDAAGRVLFGPTDTELDGTVEIDVNAGEVLVFGAKGYSEFAVTVNEDMASEETLIIQLKKVNVFIPLAITAAVVWMVTGYRKKNKIGALETKDIVNIGYIVGGIIAFGMLKKLLETLGIWKDQDAKDLDAAENNPNSFWSPNFWRGSQDYSYAISTEQAKEYAKTIYDSFGAFNDCEECAVAVFRQMRTKANVSYLADVFSQIYGQDLLKFLRGGWWPQDRLGDADVAAINRMVSALPDF